MTVATSGDALENRRKRLIFRSWHRGTREIDLIMGAFAEQHVPGFGAAEIAEYEALLDLPDLDVYDWLVLRVPVAPEHDGPVVRLLLDFVQNRNQA
ncbi:FAD assembly factor SdhE [Arenibaculum pallidiluteum]|uniref:FAD assembly factor SdhE n=1 Tax=Arenibaculum pallidiluteum TaxID=2812559 RepID=UPI001A973D8A|nr:succinate dehydrogenase assembly factor 2 [Arenibaculum pallidiluteum]